MPRTHLLNKSLEQLEPRGTLSRIYVECGFDIRSQPVAVTWGMDHGAFSRAGEQGWSGEMSEETPEGFQGVNLE